MLEKIVLYSTPFLVFSLGILAAIISASFKNIVIDRLDKLENKMDKIIDDNNNSHKEIWTEVNTLRERVAKIER